MESFRLFLIDACFVFFASCSSYNGRINKTPSNLINAASILPDLARLSAHKMIPAVKSSDYVIDQNRAFLGVTGLLFIWLLFRFHRASRPLKKQTTLSSHFQEEIKKWVGA